ncbi:hypothetical protein [Synechococcus sp. CCY 9618]|nr:hypothetical protein [Synechococcus sp. CCY 9618]
MRSPLVALCAVEACLVAGGSTSFTVTFRSDGKQIEMEKVGEPWPC